MRDARSRRRRLPAEPEGVRGGEAEGRAFVPRDRAEVLPPPRSVRVQVDVVPDSVVASAQPTLPTRGELFTRARDTSRRRAASPYFGGGGLAPMEIDSSPNLVRVGEHGIDLRARNDSIRGKLCSGIDDRSKVIKPHRDFPQVGSRDQPGAAAGRSDTERDHRMLVTAGALIGIAAQPIRQSLARRARSHAKPFSEPVVEADGHIHGHDDSVARRRRHISSPSRIVRSRPRSRRGSVARGPTDSQPQKMPVGSSPISARSGPMSRAGATSS